MLGVGFVGAFSGGLLFLIIGLGVLVLTARRYRGSWRGWSGAIYGAGASIALLLSPYVFRSSRCVQKTDPGCYQAFTVGIFVAALSLTLIGLVLAIFELRRWRRSASSEGRFG